MSATIQLHTQQPMMEHNIMGLLRKARALAHDIAAVWRELDRFWETEQAHRAEVRRYQHTLYHADHATKPATITYYGKPAPQGEMLHPDDRADDSWGHAG